MTWLHRYTCWLFHHDPYFETGLAERCALCGKERTA